MRGERVAAQFCGPAVSDEDFHYAGTAAEALAQLDGVYAQWIAGVRGLDTTGLSRPCGPSEVQYGNPADLPLVSLVLHISRDLPMFEIADVSLAVANAAPKVRRAATATIGGKAAEGVAEWLALNTQLGS